jgi:autotransporter-associated beta strand protein
MPKLNRTPFNGLGDFRQAILLPRLFMVPPKFVSPLRCATLMAAAMMIAGPAPEARAANIFWDANGASPGLGGTGNWDTTTANWYNAGVATTTSGTNAPTVYAFTAADKAYFAGTGGTVTLATNPSLGGLVFRNAAFTLNAASAQSITLGSSGISLESTSGVTTLGVNVGLVLGSSQTWTNGAAANALVVSGVISGSGALVLDGGTGGIQLLNAANDFTGPLTWSAGTLQVTKLANAGVASTIGAASSDAANLILGTNTTFKWVGDGVLSTNDSTDRLFTLGALAGAAGGLTIDASPTVDSTKAVRFTNTGALGLPPGADTYVRTLTFTGTGGTVANPNLFAPVISDNGDTFNFISNTGLIKDGTGVWKLTGANTFAGPVQILNGTLTITNIQNGLTASGLGASDSGNAGNNLIIGGPTTVGTLRFEGSGGVNNLTDRLFKINAGGATIDASGAPGTPLLFKAFAAITLGGTTARTLTLTGTNTDGNYLAQVIPDYSGAAQTSVVKNGTGTWLLKGESTYTGGTTVNAGILRMAEGHTAFGTGAITINGGMLDLGTSVVETTQGSNKYFTGTITVQGGELAALAGGSIDVSKVVGISGKISAPMYSLTSGFSKNTANTLVISGYNRYMGGTALSQGVVQVGHNFAFGATASQILSLSGSPTLSSASTTAYVLPNNVTFGAGAVLGGREHRRADLHRHGGPRFVGPLLGHQLGYHLRRRVADRRRRHLEERCRHLDARLRRQLQRRRHDRRRSRPRRQQRRPRLGHARAERHGDHLEQCFHRRGRRGFPALESGHRRRQRHARSCHRQRRPDLRGRDRSRHLRDPRRDGQFRRRLHRTDQQRREREPHQGRPGPADAFQQQHLHRRPRDQRRHRPCQRLRGRPGRRHAHARRRQPAARQRQRGELRP